MLVSLTVGKVDAGVTVLLTPDKRLIEFPSILLPPSIASGSIVDITVARNNEAEAEADKRFAELQNRIFSSFGASEPSTPVLRCRNATQTSVVLEWDPIELATADLISLSLYRNGQKAGTIPRPLQMHSTKISGLAVDTEYTFHLVLRTTAGTLSSKQVAVRTHKMTDLSGVTITTGILPSGARDELVRAVERIGARIVDGVRIDTTHFVTTEGRGLAWEKAVEMNIPVVRPEWVEACERNGRILGVTKFYLDAVRPGPGDEEAVRPSTSATTTAAPPAPAPAPASAEKQLPERPAQNGGSAKEAETKGKGEGSSNGDGAGAGDQPAGGDQNGDDAEAKSKAGGEGDKAKAADEQKVRLEDKDTQKLAQPSPGAKPAIEDPDQEREDKDGKPAVSPGDGASFQDVAL
ncbi:hypothetical protein DL766_006490 [Monosporascus sp. MC13-8B]|uniref:Chitin biosynthesis protein CHS5 n=1 Tax=Monosporascus cannonballus TaxID=155416 RepID=A0ABY0GTV9_9PEZI|nr:hypothetical protein DL763_011111 [Monosporascus cannonballus]RYO77445.1 hypothetical protein DL762_009263 [Monosporascus cannonballus]RYP27216.1 hypothetical protein DL766_006490 [Monosporascus sp. MC13-8B]